MLFRNPKPMKKFIYAMVGLFLALTILATCGHAAEFELGYGRAIIRGPTEIATATVVWPKQIGNIDLYAGAMLIGSYEYKGVEYGNQIVARAGVTPYYKNFGVSLGLAYVQHTDGLNHGGLNFNLSLSYKFGRRLRLSQEHLSNAGSQDPNTGRDMTVLAWRFK